MTPQQLKKELLKYDRQFLAELIVEAINRKKEFKTAILEKLTEKTSATRSAESDDDTAAEQRTKLNNELLTAYWKDLRKIVSKSNQYGGCEYKEENKAYQLFEKMDALLSREVVSDHLRRQIRQEAIVEHETGNSGFDEPLMDLLHQTCVYPQDWEHLVNYLENKKRDFSNYYQGLARQIRKDKLRDEAGFLQSARANLQYGTNYHELGLFYAEKNDFDKAIATMEQGLRQAEGRLDDLFDFLFSYYAECKNDQAIDQLVQMAGRRKTYQYAVGAKAFVYYQKTDYEKAKSALLSMFEDVSSLEEDAYLRLYKQAGGFLTQVDWQAAEPKLLGIIANKRPIEYLEVLLYKGEKKTVMQALQSGQVRDDWWDKGRLDRIAQRIQMDFPEEMIAYYWQKATALIDLNGRENYAKAASYLREVRQLYGEVLHQAEAFAGRLQGLRNVHQKKRALLEETESLLE